MSPAFAVLDSADLALIDPELGSYFILRTGGFENRFRFLVCQFSASRILSATRIEARTLSLISIVIRPCARNQVIEIDTHRYIATVAND